MPSSLSPDWHCFSLFSLWNVHCGHWFSARFSRWLPWTCGEGEFVIQPVLKALHTSLQVLTIRMELESRPAVTSSTFVSSVRSGTFQISWTDGARRYFLWEHPHCVTCTLRNKAYGIIVSSHWWICVAALVAWIMEEDTMMAALFSHWLFCRDHDYSCLMFIPLEPRWLSVGSNPFVAHKGSKDILSLNLAGRLNMTACNFLSGTSAAVWTAYRQIMEWLRLIWYFRSLTHQGRQISIL